MKLCLFSWRQGGGAAHPLLQVVEAAVAIDRTRDLEGWEPSNPTFSRTFPLIGTMTFVASRQLSRVLPLDG